MSGRISRLEQIDEKTITFDSLDVWVENRLVILPKETFNEISDYTRSLPTAPRPGRIYKKNLGWHESTPDNWWVFLVLDAPDGDGQLHHPFRPIFTEDVQ